VKLSINQERHVLLDVEGYFKDLYVKREKLGGYMSIESVAIENIIANVRREAYLEGYGDGLEKAAKALDYDATATAILANKAVDKGARENYRKRSNWASSIAANIRSIPVVY
jgi:hypothetical protein